MTGNNILVSQDLEKVVEQLEKQGKTTMFLSIGQTIIGIVAVADTIKETSTETVAACCKKKGIEVFMITGDNQRTAQAIAAQAGIKNVLSEVLPQEKALAIQYLQSGLKMEDWKLINTLRVTTCRVENWELKIKNSRRRRVVAMVGDGINDAPALAQADLGVAMGSGTDVAMETGGVVIIKNDLRNVLTAIDLSHAAISKIKQNMFFALFYNIVGIPIAARALIGLGLVLKPELAGLAMALSSVSVVSNSLLLKRFKTGRRDVISSVAPFLMGLLFIALFLLFAKLSGR